MDVKEAVKRAKEEVVALFEEEGVRNLGLEEVEYDSSREEWIITIGFSRPWDSPVNVFAAAAGGGPRRTYKVVRINGETGEAKSVKNRE